MQEAWVHVVDDNEYDRVAIGKLLNEKGFYCIFFSDPLEFLKDERKKRLCIVDYRFPNTGMDGLEIAEEVLEQFINSQIIIITGYLTNNLILKLMNLGVIGLDKNDAEFQKDLIKNVKKAAVRVEHFVKLENLKGDGLA